MLIRAEASEDHLAVQALNRVAFGGSAEARLVDELRREARPLVSLVAEEDGAIVGHIMFSPVSLPGPAGLLMGLGPMAVAPTRQGAGIGSALVRAGLERCRQIGAVAVVVVGHPEYYPRFGFSAAADFGLTCEYEVPREAFMAVELQPGALSRASGTIKYHAAFGDL